MRGELDALEYWKCHLRAGANDRFLVVPQALQHNQDMTPKREFVSVKRRLEPFFKPGNYTIVRGLALFGY